MIVDTDVLIWHMRGNRKAKKVFDNIGSFSISAISNMELIQGLRNKNELKALKDFLKDFGITILPIDERITNRAIFFMEEHFLKHNLRMADALIGSTASVLNKPLLTGNVKHYKMLKSVNLKKF